MTTVRLSDAQRRRLEEGKRVLEDAEGKKLTQGEAIAELAQFTIRHRGILAEEPQAARLDLEGDSLLDMTLVFDMGRTNPRTIDRLLYGKQ